ncbi:hypothetical protein ACFQY7_37630 [Actinomadura luteofluorescens]|uniref:hypothetical protein n=1 Tax=Actinomadura luteofluorescens TaxID=46163 RepID=UPI003637E0C2
MTGARLGQARGHRRMFLLGLGAFTAASLACGLAPPPARSSPRGWRRGRPGR